MSLIHSNLTERLQCCLVYWLVHHAINSKNTIAYAIIISPFFLFSIYCIKSDKIVEGIPWYWFTIFTESSKICIVRLGLNLLKIQVPNPKKFYKISTQIKEKFPPIYASDSMLIMKHHNFLSFLKQYLFVMQTYLEILQKFYQFFELIY